MDAWNSDLAMAPRGKDLLVAMSTACPDGRCATMIGRLIWEPLDVDPDAEDDEGYIAVLNGIPGIYYWHCSDADGFVPKKWLRAWRSLPEPFVINT